MRMQRCTLKIFSELSVNRGHDWASITPLERKSRQRFPPERRLRCSSVLQNSQECWIGENHARLGARHPLERKTQGHAWASITPLERTPKQCKILGARISRSSVSHPARAWVQNLEFPDLNLKIKFNFKCIKFNPLGLISWKTFANT